MAHHCAFKLTRVSDGATYVFLRSTCSTWVRTDTRDVFFLRSNAEWYVTTTADSSQHLGWHVPQDRDSQQEHVDSDSPPTGKWVSQKGDKSYEYVLEFIPATTDLAAEYETQDRLRRWDQMIERLMVVSHRNGSAPGPRSSKTKFGTFFDLGCGAGPISRRIAGRNMAETLISVDLDEAMVAHTCFAIQGTIADQDTPSDLNLSVRLADLTALTGKSIYSARSWRPDASDSDANRNINVIWSSFCTAYFHSHGIGNVLRHWANTLLDSGGLICLVEIQGLFSAHGLTSRTSSEPESSEDDQASGLQQLFQQADANILSSLQNDVLAGTRLEEIVREELSDLLEILDATDWEDGELAFEGRASDECLEQWAKRLRRPAIAEAIKGLTSEGGKSFGDLFLGCLSSERHTTVRKVKMVILKKR